MNRNPLGVPAGMLAGALVCACSTMATRVARSPGDPPNAPSDAAAAQAAVDGAMRRRGYKPELYQGNRVYCRNETLTGSNLPSKICLTAQQITDQEQAGKAIVNGYRPAGCQPPNPCK